MNHNATRNHAWTTHLVLGRALHVFMFLVQTCPQQSNGWTNSANDWWVTGGPASRTYSLAKRGYRNLQSKYWAV